MAEPIMRLADEGGRRGLSKRLGFTVASLERLTCPAGKGRLWAYDTRTPGLAFMVTEKGARSFYVYRKVHGRPQRIRLGGFPDLSIEQARKMAARTLGEIAEGRDPMAERRAVRQSDTLQELFDRWKKEHASVRLSPNTLSSDACRFNLCFGDWKNRKLSTIREADVRAKHAAIGKSQGQITANRAVQLLRRLFNWARIEPNPAAKRAVELFRETPRDRFVQADELPALLAAIDAEVDDFPDFFKLALYTGARRSNVQAMAWAELDLTRRTWTIPAAKAKAHEPIIVPLSDPAVQILKSRLEARQDESPWVFPSHGATGHLVEPKTAWGRILKRAKISNLRIHDLRRTLGSWQAVTGASLPVIGKSLGHRNVATTAIYARLNIEPVRQAVDTATAAILKAATAKPKKGKAKKGTESPQDATDGERGQG